MYFNLKIFNPLHDCYNLKSIFLKLLCSVRSRQREQGVMGYFKNIWKRNHEILRKRRYLVPEIEEKRENFA